MLYFCTINHGNFPFFQKAFSAFGFTYRKTRPGMPVITHFPVILYKLRRKMSIATPEKTDRNISNFPWGFFLIFPEWFSREKPY